MKDDKKIEIFDKCFNKEMIDLLDSLSDEQLGNLCTNVSKLVSGNNSIIKRQVKKMANKR